MAPLALVISDLSMGGMGFVSVMLSNVSMICTTRALVLPGTDAELVSIHIVVCRHKHWSKHSSISSAAGMVQEFRQSDI